MAYVMESQWWVLMVPRAHYVNLLGRGGTTDLGLNIFFFQNFNLKRIKNGKLDT